MSDYLYIDADLLDNGTRHPNIALEKHAGYMEDLGHTVKLAQSYDTSELRSADWVILSKVFRFTKIPEGVFGHPKIIAGGTGFLPENFTREDCLALSDLPYAIEHHKPKYNLYDDFIKNEIARGIKPSKFTDYTDYSIGFATRGCHNKCAFCVNQKYEKAYRHAPISEFFEPSRKYIYLWDDNVFACKDWRDVFDELNDLGRPFQFRQGLDLRLTTKEKAQVLAGSKYRGDIIFAFDDIKDRELIEKKLQLWREYSDRTTKLFVLCAYSSQDVADVVSVFERIRILMKYGCLPYIMRFESYKGSEMEKIYITLARWCNQPSHFKKKSFREFCEMRGDSLVYMQDFESKNTEIAREYFDLKFEELKRY